MKVEVTVHLGVMSSYKREQYIVSTGKKKAVIIKSVNRNKEEK